MVQPTVLFAVPSLYKKVYDGVQNLIGNSSPTKQKLMHAALDLGKKKKASGGNLGFIDGLKYKVLDSLVTSKIRGRFGGKLRHGFVGGAATPKDIIDFMDNIGIPICEGYGENTCLLSFLVSLTLWQYFSQSNFCNLITQSRVN